MVRKESQGGGRMQRSKMELDQYNETCYHAAQVEYKRFVATSLLIEKGNTTFKHIVYIEVNETIVTSSFQSNLITMPIETH